MVYNEKTIMQEKLQAALSSIPGKTTGPKSYFRELFKLFQGFNIELNNNLEGYECHERCIDYLTDLDTHFRGMYMLFDSTFDVFINGDQIESIQHHTCKVKSYNEAHVHIYKLLIYTLRVKKKDIVVKQKIKCKF